MRIRAYPHLNTSGIYINMHSDPCTATYIWSTQNIAQHTHAVITHTCSLILLKHSKLSDCIICGGLHALNFLTKQISDSNFLFVCTCCCAAVFFCVWTGVFLSINHPLAALIAVHGAWDEWSPWSLCSSTCGRGYRERTRTCKPPQFGGDECVGPEKQTKFCNIAVCPGEDL